MPILEARVKGKQRLATIKAHRLDQYLTALDKLFEGRESPEWVSMRARKLAEVNKR